MAIQYWDPFREVASIQNRLSSLMQNYDRSNPQDVTAASFAPPVDVYEDENAVVLNLEIPGVRQEDLDIQVEKNTLSVRGERKFEGGQKEENFHRIERRFGTFYRSFSLPATVDVENVHATYDAGVLRLELTKKAEAKPKQIKVNITGSSAKPLEASNATKAGQAAGTAGQSKVAAAVQERELAAV